MSKPPLLTKMETAVAILEQLFAHKSRITIAEAVAAGDEQGVSRRTLTRACRQLDVHEVHNGCYGAFWERRT